MSNEERIRSMLTAARQLVALLSDPQPGLLTWYEFVDTRVKEIATIYSYYEVGKVIEVEEMDSKVRRLVVWILRNDKIKPKLTVDLLDQISCIYDIDSSEIGEVIDAEIDEIDAEIDAENERSKAENDADQPPD